MPLRTQRRSVAWRSVLPPAAIVVAGVVGGVFMSTTESVGAQDAGGAELYATHCAGCHQPAGEGLPGAFPPLAGNPNATDGEYVVVVIRNGVSGPIEVNGVAWDAAMPPVEGLSDDEVAAIVDHVVGLAAVGAEAGNTEETEETGDETDDTDPPPPPAAPTVGDIDRGHDLFVGSTRFDEGAVGCASCHAAGEVGDLGGQMLGPDLTDAYARFGGETGLAAWLANPSSETMRPIFTERPVTDAEIADLVAFLGDAPDQDRPNDTVDWLLVAGLGGLVVLLGGMAVAWRGMRQTYVSTLRSRR